MTHDRDGAELAVGDYVLIPCRIESMADVQQIHNIRLETVEPRNVGSLPTQIWIHARQVVKGTAPKPVPAEPPAAEPEPAASAAAPAAASAATEGDQTTTPAAAPSPAKLGPPPGGTG